MADQLTNKQAQEIVNEQRSRMPDADKFHDSDTAVLFFARILDEIGGFHETSNVIDYFAQPYKWKAEYQRWLDVGSPIDAKVLRFHAYFICAGLVIDDAEEK